MAHDVFISYSTHDKAVADRICHALEERQIRCWIAPRDVPYGADWPRAIMDALATARAVVLVFTRNTNASQAVRKEVLTAVENGAIVIPFRTEEVLPEGALKFNLIDVHWLDAFAPPLDDHIDRLVQTIGRLTAQDRPPPLPSDEDAAGGGPGGDIPPDFAEAERQKRDQLEQLRRDKLQRRRRMEIPPGDGGGGPGPGGPDPGGMGRAPGGGAPGPGPIRPPGQPEPPPQVVPPQTWIQTPLHRQFYAFVLLAVLLSLLVGVSLWWLLAAPLGLAGLWRRSYVPKANLPVPPTRALRIATTAIVALIALGIGAVRLGAHGAATHHDYHITIANQTGQTISNIFAYHQNGPANTQDRLGATTLATGSSLQLDLNDGSGECYWDFRAVAPSGPNISQDGVNVCTTSTLTLQPNSGASAPGPAAPGTNTMSDSGELSGGNSTGAARFALRITNDSGKIIRNLYTSSDGTTWGADLLGSHTLGPGASIRVNLDDGSGECTRSLKAVFFDATDVEHDAVDVCATSTYNFTG